MQRTCRLAHGSGRRMRRHSRTGCAGDFLLSRARSRGASGLQDLSVRREGERDANGLALVTKIIEHDAVVGRRDFLQPETRSARSHRAAAASRLQVQRGLRDSISSQPHSNSRHRRRDRAAPQGRASCTRPASRPPELPDRNRQPNRSSPSRSRPSSQVVSGRVAKYRDRRERRLNCHAVAISSSNAETILAEKGSLKRPGNYRRRNNLGARCPRHHTPSAITTAKVSVNQVMEYCR